MKPMDPRLIAAFRAGNTAAFDTLYALFTRRVLAFARRLTGSQADAEDLTQEAFLAAFRAHQEFRGEAQFLTWLFGIVVRRWRDGARRPRLSTVSYLDADIDTMNSCGRGSDMAEETVRKTMLNLAIDALNPPLREAFLLVAMEGLNHREAAVIVGCPLGTIKWRVAEASHRLRNALQEAEETEKQDVLCVLP